MREAACLSAAPVFVFRSCCLVCAQVEHVAASTQSGNDLRTHTTPVSLKATAATTAWLRRSKKARKAGTSVHA